MAAFTAPRQPFSSRARSASPMRGRQTAGASSGAVHSSGVRPTPKAASRAAPMAVISWKAGRSTSTSQMSATNCMAKALAVTPPSTLSRVSDGAPSAFRASSRSRV
ncbi:hypothetical protein D3C87_1838470 [compost metagenome]